MTTATAIGQHRDDGELERFSRLVSEAFVIPPDRLPRYLESVGHENVRVIHRDGAVIGGLVLLPKGQWFGGRSVPMTGIAVVAVAPEHRAGGAATQLLTAVVQEMYETGTPISTLYPATLALYRRVGYESAGLACEVTLPAKSIDLRDRTLTMRAATAEDEAQIHAVYRQWASRTAGNLDRSEFNWARVREFMKEPTQGYVVCRGERIEGYVYVLSQTLEGPRWNLRVHDIAALTPEAARRLLTFVADYRTVRDQVILRSGPADPLLVHLAEAPYTITSRAPWMLRVVHVPKALAARGYSAGVNAELHFSIRDEVLPQNAGRHVLRIRDGNGVVEPGGRGSFDIDVRGLAAMYTGFLSPQDVVLAGLATAPESDLSAAAGVFAGPLPWMRDAF